MSTSLPPRPPAEGGTRGTKPLGRRSSRRLVLAAIAFAVLFALFTIYMVVRTSNDPDIQRGIDEYRQDAGQEAPRPDTSGR